LIPTFQKTKNFLKNFNKQSKETLNLQIQRLLKNVKDTLSFGKLLSVDYINQIDRPKKKLKLQSRNKKTAARFIRKPKIKSAMELIDDKIIQLEKDMKKTGF
jgi:hypothetical protein